MVYNSISVNDSSERILELRSINHNIRYQPGILNSRLHTVQNISWCMNLSVIASTDENSQDICCTNVFYGEENKYDIVIRKESYAFIHVR